MDVTLQSPLRATAKSFTPRRSLQASAVPFTPRCYHAPLNPLAGVFALPSVFVKRTRPLSEASNAVGSAGGHLYNRDLIIHPHPAPPTVLTAASKAGAAPTLLRALDPIHLHEYWDVEPEAPVLPLSAPDPVTMHTPTLSTKDPALSRSTSSHSGNLPPVPRFSSGRPPDLLVDRPDNDNAPHTDESSARSSPPLLLLDQAAAINNRSATPVEATNARSTTNAPAPTPTAATATIG